MSSDLCNAEEVLLEDVELILEAFDYLQLPFALKQGKSSNIVILLFQRSKIFFVYQDYGNH